LRGAGDTLVPAVVLGVLVWTICVGGSVVVARTWPELGAIGPWAATTLYGVCLGVFLMVRFCLGGWKRIRLHGESSLSKELTVSDKVPGLELIAERP
ncbi:MAG: hypothetical protein NZ561_05825, partial [Phycisphaerae bacterium]|nr:hypothetical protein [Phycisphaerae bacterium]